MWRGGLSGTILLKFMMLDLFILHLVSVFAVMSFYSGMGDTFNIRMKTWNVRGYISTTPYLRHLLGECDILCINEHWLHEK